MALLVRPDGPGGPEKNVGDRIGQKLETHGASDFDLDMQSRGVNYVPPKVRNMAGAQFPRNWAQ